MAIKRIYGIGINDVNRQINVNGKIDKSYETWRGMFKRCSESEERNPTYKECSVCDDWIYFSKFDDWFNENYIDGFELDKDLKVFGNKVYSPESCMFIPRSINACMNLHGRRNGKFPPGITENERGRLKVRVQNKGKRIYGGLFDSKKDAAVAYWKLKKKCILELCSDEIEKNADNDLAVQNIKAAMNQILKKCNLEINSLAAENQE